MCINTNIIESIKRTYPHNSFHHWCILGDILSWCR